MPRETVWESVRRDRLSVHKRSRAFSRRYVCDVSRANQSVPGIRAARSRVARIVLRTCVPRGAMHSDVHLTLYYGAGAQSKLLYG